MQVRFTVRAGEESYMVTRPVRKGVAAEEERNARDFMRKVGSNSYGVRTELLSHG
jgi:hypothetical protein